MSSFTKLPPLVAIPPDYKLYRTQVAFTYYVGSTLSGEAIYVPEDFLTDGASIPKIFWSIIGGVLGRYGAAAVLHDFLYVEGIYTRRRSDKIFLEAMKVLKVSWWKRRAMYYAVRGFAWGPWKRYHKKDSNR